MRVWVEDEGLDYRHDGTAWNRSALRPDGLYFSGVRVVGNRQAAIANPAGGAIVDSESRSAILAILNVLKNHGLIDGGI